MLKVDGNEISLTRGDTASLSIKIKTTDGYYKFTNGEKISFRVYKKKELEKEPVIVKDIFVEEEETEQVEIDLSSLDTKIGELENKTITYWYEIILNDDITIIGYDDSGAKLFNIFPEGSVD